MSTATWPRLTKQVFVPEKTGAEWQTSGCGGWGRNEENCNRPQKPIIVSTSFVETGRGGWGDLCPIFRARPEISRPPTEQWWPLLARYSPYRSVACPVTSLLAPPHHGNRRSCKQNQREEYAENARPRVRVPWVVKADQFPSVHHNSTKCSREKSTWTLTSVFHRSFFFLIC